MPPPHKKVAECFCCEYWREEIRKVLEALIAEEGERKQATAKSSTHHESQAN